MSDRKAQKGDGMSEITIGELEGISSDFIPAEYRPDKGDRHAFMNPPPGADGYRRLKAQEIEVLAKNGNTAEDWGEILVRKGFSPDLVINCDFFGRVYLGDMRPQYISYNDLSLPVGLRNSTIISCVIGDNVAIRDVHYLSHYLVSPNCILFNVDELICTNHAKFGNGIVKEGEGEDVRIWLEVGNENEGRKILAFEGLIPADAYLWSKYRDDEALMGALKELTDRGFSKKRGFYGEIGENCVIKNCSIIKDVKVGPYAYVKGANKLKNLTILSSKEERTQIGEGVELVNGIVGFGSRIFYGSKAIRFVTGRNTQLKYGARLLNSVLGDNSTVSCCELLNNLIFPFHEQHHNNSFLIATTILGQSNIAAGATIGSNHNSRAPEGEILAGRGFWPGLCTNFKHNCRFASFTLVAKGSYSHELNIAYPFSLVSTSREDERVRVSPAYWFVHNMYAMARNSWKFRKRDARAVKVQNVELEFLAPDTVQETLLAMDRLELLRGRLALGGRAEEGECAAEGRRLLSDPGADDPALDDPMLMKGYGGLVEKPARGWRYYRDFCLYFAAKTLVDFFRTEAQAGLGAFIAKAVALKAVPDSLSWVNLGGQLVAAGDLAALKADIVSGAIKDWEGVHARYDSLWNSYPERKARYAVGVLERLLGRDAAALDAEAWGKILQGAGATFRLIRDSSYASRKKDYDDPFRKMSYDNEAEMTAVLGKFDDNSFLKDISRQTAEYEALFASMLDQAEPS
jgi:hypothetical protein